MKPTRCGALAAWLVLGFAPLAATAAPAAAVTQPSSAPAPAPPPAAAATQPAGAAPPAAGEPTTEALEAEFGATLAADRAQTASQGGAAAAGSGDGAIGVASPALSNPELSVIGVFAGSYWVHDDRPPGFSAADDPLGEGATVQELELAFASDVDPYFQMRAFLALHEAEIEIEEAYAVTTTLPWSLLFRGGFFRSAFGRDNRLHLHVEDFARRPPTTELLGEDGLRAAGGQLSVLLPLPWYTTLTGELLSLETAHPSGMLTIEQYFELSRTWSLLVGTSGALLHRGPAEATEAEPAPLDPGREWLLGADVYFKWRPTNVVQTYAWVALTAEYVARRQEEADGWDGTGYAQAVAQVARRWRVGLRAGFAGLPDATLGRREGIAAASIAFVPSEFSRLRFTAEHHQDLDDASVNNQLFILQLEASIGAHGAHAF